MLISIALPDGLPALIKLISSPISILVPVLLDGGANVQWAVELFVLFFVAVLHPGNIKGHIRMGTDL